jgi:hypothetical protein
MTSRCPNGPEVSSRNRDRLREHISRRRGERNVTPRRKGRRHHRGRPGLGCSLAVMLAQERAAIIAVDIVSQIDTVPVPYAMATPEDLAQTG